MHAHTKQHEGYTHVSVAQAVIKMCTQLSRAKLIMARVNLAVEMYPGSLFGPLAIGTLCACGGKLLQDTIRMAQVRVYVPAHARSGRMHECLHL